jgi:DNA-binding NarL/FixJ family response regulator
MRYGSIVLADRHPSMLTGIRSLLATEADTILMAVDEASLMLAVAKVIPDLVIADISFPVSGGTNLVKLIKQCNPAIKIIILSMYEDPLVVGEIMKDGADGVVLKQRAVVDLIPAVREVCQDRLYVPPGMEAETQNEVE